MSEDESVKLARDDQANFTVRCFHCPSVAISWEMMVAEGQADPTSGTYNVP
jgi:hypothetical protein